MEVMELSSKYLNSLAQQFIFICSFLGGFSATILGTLIASEIRTKYSKIMVVSSSFAAMCFIVTLFGMTGIFYMTTEGYPLEADPEKMLLMRVISLISLILGLLSFMICIASSGWLISKKIGWFTTILGILAFVLIVVMM